MKILNFNETFLPNYEILAKICKHIGNELNSEKNRFDKSDILEQALEMITGGKLQWVDKKGYDHFCPAFNYKVEMKSGLCALFTEKRKDRTKCTTLKLTNTLQKKSNKKKLELTADDLIIVDTFHGAVGRVPYGVAIEHSIEKPDGFVVKIPPEEIEILFEGVIESQPATNVGSYIQQKNKMQKDYIQSFFS